MPEFVIRLDPRELSNPDADIRYLLPDAIVEKAPENIRDDGYDYDAKGRMLVFLTARGADAALPIILDVLRKRSIARNRLTKVAVVGLADEDHCNELSKFRVVYSPSGAESLVD